jgi:transcriptional regulator GlxA family with amidase domain
MDIGSVRFCRFFVIAEHRIFWNKEIVKTTEKNQSRRISMLAFDRAEALDVTGPLEVFAVANDFIRDEKTPDVRAYRIEIVAEEKGPVTMSSGIRLVADRSWLSGFEGVDTLIVAGGVGTKEAARNITLQAVLQDQNTRARRIASVCTGSFILAEAGLLEGKRATTHWSRCELLAREYPAVHVEPDRIFVRDGHIYTSAGVTAGIDLALALVEEDHGRHVALKVAKTLVVFMKRPGGQSQFSTHLLAQANAKGVLKGLPEWISENPRRDLSVQELATKAGMSERNFSRVFARQMGMTPAKFVEALRIDQATYHLENEALSLEEVAHKSGFRTSERMRRAFKRNLQVLPVTYRKRFGV